MTTTRSEQVFAGRKEVVLLDDCGHFRELSGLNSRRYFVHGNPLGVSDSSLVQRTGFSDLAGCFLILVHDAREHTLTIHTDRHGFIPFYSTRSGGRLYLSTRTGSMLARKLISGDRELTALSDMLAFSSPIGNRTPLAGVENIEATDATVIDLDTLDTRHTQRWSPADILRGPRLSYTEADQELCSLFLEATRRCIGDNGPVALTLSGGMDTRCLLAAVLHLGRDATAYNVGVPGSRAATYSRNIADICAIPLHAQMLDADFPKQYYGLCERVVASYEGMRLNPQPEMLWLRDRVETPAVLLHGAFGELAKLRALRIFHVNEAVMRTDRDGLADVLWSRVEPAFRSSLRIFSPEVRAVLDSAAREHLRDKVAAVDNDLDVRGTLQVLYFDEFIKAARHPHRIWNEHVPTHAPFIDPAFTDLLLRVRDDDRMEQKFQYSFLARINPQLIRLPDENTGTLAGSSGIRKSLVRLLDKARIALLDSKASNNHGDLISWLCNMQPSPEEVLQQCAGNDFYDRAALAGMISFVRSFAERSAPLRAPLLRKARLDALALQTFFLVSHWDRFISASLQRHH